MSIKAMGKTTHQEQCWQAVQRRDVNADGTFVYAVISTGVFCHPSCPSRQAARENLRFFDTAQLALEAGFRACKRCLPVAGTPAQQRAELVQQAAHLLGAGDQTGIADVARTLGVGRQRLAALFKQATGLSAKQWQLAHRRELIAEQTLTASRITDAVYESGYASTSRFYADARDRLGMSPSDLRSGADGEIMRYAIADSVLGQLLVAWTDKGLSSVELAPEGMQDDWLESRLATRFFRATLTRDQQAGQDLVSAVVSRIEEPQDAQSLTLDIRGTAFQQRVWTALTNIPVGKTASYGEVANAMGSPRSHRAVATACAANPLAIVVPCHRVVRADGSLSGYRWGTARKQLLLDRERAAVHK